MRAGDRVGPYEVVSPLGAGGMGEVYRARDTRLGRDVAIKVLPAEFAGDPERLRRFEQEARAVAALDHPNILAVHDVGSHGGAPYIVTEVLAGETLRARLREGGLTPRKAVEYGVQICHGLSAAHEKGIVHRDIKPENLFLTTDGQVKILDFGIAKLVPIKDAGELTTGTTVARGTEPGVAIGTVGYMSPEQLRGQPVDQLTDIFALGCVLYEMVSGRRAFAGETAADTITAILSKDPAPLAGPGREIPAALEGIVNRCLEKRPEDRFQSAKDLGFAFQAISAPAEVTVGPAVAPAGGRTQERVSRGLRVLARPIVSVPIVILAAAVAVVLLVKPRPALSFAPRDWILVADVQNDTGQAMFDRSLLTALTVSLEQSRHANVFPRSRVGEALVRMKRDPALRIDAELGREVCVRENVRGLVTWSIARVGSRYTLSVRIVDPRTGEAVRSFEEQAAGQDEILPALSSLAARIREALGESLEAIQKSNRPLPEVTTASLHALQLYAEGQHLWVRGRYFEAVELYESAVQEDPEFAMAYAALGNAYLSHIYNEQPKGRACYDKALQLASRTTDRERLLLRADSAGARGDVAEHVRLLRAYLATYPDDVAIRYSLGTMLMRNRQPAEALEEFQAVTRVMPYRADAFINTATSLNQLGRNREALDAYAQAFALEPTWEVSANLNHEYGFALVAAGEVAKAREVFAKAVATKDLHAKGLRSLALLELFEGRYRDAAARLREAILVNEAVRSDLSAARDRAYLATVLEGQGDRAGQLAELGRANAILDRLTVPVIWHAQLGVAYARAGSVARAERLRESAARNARRESLDETSKLHWLEGEIELARGRHAEALEKLRLADREFRTELTVESLARAARSAGAVAEAVAAYDELFAMDALGWEAQQPWVTAHYDAALAYRSAGQLDKARAAADALLTMWKDADPDLPLLVKARALRAELGRP